MSIGAVADGSIPEHEELLVDLHGLPDGAKRPYVGERASAYGEVTRDGARILFESMGLVSLPRSETARQDVLSSPAVFADLGSGAGRLVARPGSSCRVSYERSALSSRHLGMRWLSRLVVGSHFGRRSCLSEDGRGEWPIAATERLVKNSKPVRSTRLHAGS